jgi:hypothetical protein
MERSVDIYLQSMGYALAGWLSVLAGLVAGFNAGIALLWGPSLWLGSLFVLISLLFLLTGAVAHPKSRKRLADRDSPLVNGRKRTVSERSLSPAHDENASCVVCGSDAREGKRRDSRIEYVLAGITVVSSTKRQNWYCESCLRNENGGEVDAVDGSPSRESERETIRE